MNLWSCGNCFKSESDQVRHFDLSHFLLQEIPSEVFLHQRTLEKLYLDANRITEMPRQLFNLEELRVLNISDNEISFLPPAISSLVNLQILDISRNALTTLPENIKSCNHLVYLDISVNPLEKIPDCLTSLISLQELYLSDVFLEFLPANFGRLINLKILELRENSLSTLPKTMNRLVNLTRLDIGQNEFTELPDIVGTMHNLTELWIDGNHIRKLSATIGQLRKLVHFEASNNLIEKLPSEIGYWTKISEFSVSNNELTELPSTIGNMKHLVSLRLDENQVQSLPESIGKLTCLEELMVAYNCLSYLPPTIGLLRKLQCLIVDSNFLTEIPPEVGSCHCLSVLSLQGNKITSIPGEIGQLSNLRVLNLVNNCLHSLPVSLLKLGRLSALWLAENQSQPLVPLQKEFDLDSRQVVLTCFMLPQLANEAKGSQNDNTVISHPVQKKHICFASEAAVKIEQPGRLTRAPTPYPKELRALAKHAKNVHNGLVLSHPQNTELPVPLAKGAVQIKEAVVTPARNENPHVLVNDAKPNLEPLVISPKSHVHSESDYSNFMVTKDDFDSGPPIKQVTKDIYSPVAVSFSNSNAVIRQAKNVRMDNHNNTQSPDSAYSNSTSLETCRLEPPPYHIAAAYSLQAQYFNSLDCPDNVGSRSESVRTGMEHDDDLDTCSMRNRFHDSEKFGTEYKPQTFIQDKPVPGKNIVAPTPKRPSGQEQSILIGEQGNSCKEYRQFSSNTGTLLAENFVATDVCSPNENRTNHFKWLFGNHKNAKVLEISLQRNPDLGFDISERPEGGIIISGVDPSGPAYSILHPGDKLLEVDGIDFTTVRLCEALNVLTSTGSVLNLLISHS